MPEPLPSTAAAATLATTTAALPVLQAAAHAVPTLQLFGVSLGLRADVLLAGFFGGLVAIVLLNTVPATGDTLRQLARTSLRRMVIALASAATAGYTAPLLLVFDRMPDPLLLPISFTVGVFAQQQLARMGKRLGMGQQPDQEAPRG